MIVAAFVSDRGDKYLPGCMASFVEHVEPVTKDLHVVDDRNHLLGMAGAVRAAWDWALSTDCDHLLHIEEDFVFDRPVPLTDMADILDRNPHLAQVVLKRQPWSSEEHAAGGIIEMNPDAYTDRTGWVEHTRLFSVNPCLIPRRVLELDWSTSHPGGVERAITDACLAAGFSFGYLGSKTDPPRCTHVGHERAAGYRW